MPLDSSIPLQGREFRLMSPVEAQSQALQLRSLQAQEQQRQAQAMAAQRAQQDQVALSDIYRSHYNNPEEFDRTAAQRGLGHALPGIQKGRAEIDEKRAKTKETEAQTKNFESIIAERGIDAIIKQAKYVTDAAGWMANKPDLTDDDVVRMLAKSPEPMRKAAEQVMSTVPWGQGTRALQGWAMNLGAKTEERLKMLPQFQKIDQGGSVVMGAVDPMTGQFAQQGAMRKSVTPDAAMVDARVRSEGEANREVQRYGIDQVSVRQKEANEVAATGNVIKTETDLRKEFADLPEVKRYKASLPAYNAVVSASTRNTPQSDINLVYGLAKLYDPDSVVREGEYATIANSQAIPEWLKGLAQRVTGGGRLTAETKAQVMTEAKGRIGSYQGEYEGAQSTYQQIVSGRGGNPGNVFTPVGVSKPAQQPENRPPLSGFGGNRPSLDSFNR